MAQKINVEGHIKRYEDTLLTDVVALIEGLSQMVERKKAELVVQLREQLAVLESGQLPPEPPKPEPTVSTRTRKTRGGKEVNQDEQA